MGSDDLLHYRNTDLPASGLLNPFPQLSWQEASYKRHTDLI